MLENLLRGACCEVCVTRCVLRGVCYEVCVAGCVMHDPGCVVKKNM
jgi:hypothetical protein